MPSIADYSDWHPAKMPDNVVLGEGALLESTYSLGGFRSELDAALTLGDDSAIWNPAMLYVGPAGRLEIGSVTCINQSIIEANESVRIGSYVNIAWGAVISDSLLARAVPVTERRLSVLRAAASPDRMLVVDAEIRPVVVEDDVWIGFEAVVGPGVTVGRGAIVGAKSWVNQDVEPFAIVAGCPARVIGSAATSDWERS